MHRCACFVNTLIWMRSLYNANRRLCQIDVSIVRAAIDSGDSTSCRVRLRCCVFRLPDSFVQVGCNHVFRLAIRCYRKKRNVIINTHAWENQHHILKKLVYLSNTLNNIIIHGLFQARTHIHTYNTR